MQDAVTSLLNKYDLTGKYLDNVAIYELSDYFSTALNRIRIIELISENASKIIKEASARLYEEQPELLRPGGNSYTTRRYAACLRDIEYYLRYASYSLIADDICILNERVLDGLKDTYNSLSVPISPTIRSIQLLEDVIKEKAIAKKITGFSMINKPFNHMIQSLSEQDI
uniref:Allophycocyanin beta 18 subunit n=1 Tax=Rhodymenia pseudopalmata TaxID=31502 RepID=A0A1C9C7J9_RHOPU|nr:Allophycocyanin beta 18 subunit [Rhodymenia pseudopalmata]AOM64352.1 Allophycocyanin beta 18 subunit [Rhodymenia pseudopalmata]